MVLWHDAPRWTARTSKNMSLKHSSRPRVLIATNTGWHLESGAVDSLLATALDSEGAEVHVALCPGDLEACMPCSTTVITPSSLARSGPKPFLCGSCTKSGTRHFKNSPAIQHPLSQYLTDTKRSEINRMVREVPASAIATFQYDDQPLGEAAIAGSIRYFATTQIPNTPTAEVILRKYLASAIAAYESSKQMIQNLDVDTVVVHHGIYVPQGPTLLAAMALNRRVITWTTGYRTGTLLFVEGDTYHRIMLAEKDEHWRVPNWDGEKRAHVESYLRERRTGASDWIRWNDPKNDRGNDVETAASEDAYCLVLPNVSWDAQLHFPERAFSDQEEWLTAVLEFAASRPSTKFVIRGHPGEISGFTPSRRTVADFLKDHPQPTNVTLIHADSPVSTYDLIDRANLILVYASKVGLEAACQGKLVIVSGEAWYRGKGFTVDVLSKKQFADTLGEALNHPTALSPELRDRALEYAYSLFFTKMIKLSALEDLSRRRWRVGRGVFRLSKRIRSPEDLHHDPKVRGLASFILSANATQGGE